MSIELKLPGVPAAFSQGVGLAAFARWFGSGVAFIGLSVPLLYLLTDVAGLPFPVTSLVVGELLLVARFLVNDRFVFRRPAPTWRRFAEYHAAAAGSFAVWWVVANALSHVGVHYVLASFGGTAASVCVNLVTNFLWIWAPGRERR